MSMTRQDIIDEECLIVRHSGEIPEITYHHSLYYLCQDPEGPSFRLSEAELTQLQEQALERSREIVLRDLDPANRDLSIYRGVRRSIWNWQRHLRFCRRLGRQDPGFAAVVCDALVRFLEQEITDVRTGRRVSSVNCTAAQLQAFVRELDCDGGALPQGWQDLCLDDGEVE